MNLIDPFINQVERVPDRLAIITQNESITFSGLHERSSNLAYAFQQKGLKAGDNVLVLQSFDIPLYVTLLALFRMGAVAVFPDVSARITTMDDCCHHLPIKGFCGGWKAHLLRAVFPAMRAIPLSLPRRSDFQTPSVVCNLSENHPALVTFTSGSTGRPKGIIRSHGFLLKQHEMISDMLEPEADDISLISLPVFILSNLASGVTSVIPQGNLKKPGRMKVVPLLKQINEHRVNSILMPPALCRNLVQANQRLLQIKKIFTGGGPVFPDLLLGLSDMAPQAHITSVYGSTEAEPIAHAQFSDISENDLNAMKSGEGLLVGRPVEGIDVQIINDEIYVTGDHVIKSYLNRSDNSSTKIEMDGMIWHRTGDAGRFDAQGRLWLLGRIDARHDNIYPFCIETAARILCAGSSAAFLHHKGKNVLIVQGKDMQANLLDPLKTKFGDFDIIHVKAIPLDRRHNSKVDYGQLRSLLDKLYQRG